MTDIVNFKKTIFKKIKKQQQYFQNISTWMENKNHYLVVNIKYSAMQRKWLGIGMRILEIRML